MSAESLVLFMFKLQRLFMAVQGQTDTVIRSVRSHKGQLQVWDGQAQGVITDAKVPVQEMRRRRHSHGAAWYRKSISGMFWSEVGPGSLFAL